MWKAYTGAGEIDAQDTYCAATGALLKEMAARGVVDCVYSRFVHYRTCELVVCGYEFLTANEQQVFDVRTGGFQLHECNRPAPFEWRANEYRKSSSFAKLISEVQLLDDNTLYCFAEE